ncbi:MAG TPA: aminotransferase class IV, partial [Membranihabitans sp.]|nr:aminotransferase class IV [Membranihabitans sp.]
REYPTIKSINYMTVLLARDRLREEAAEDVLYYSPESVTESSRSNFFIIDKNNILKTPGNNILAGITRSKVLGVSKNLIEVQITDVTLDEVREARSAFLTSTTKGIMPVTRIDDFAINEGRIDPVIAKLQHGLEQETKRYIQEAVIKF